MNKLKFTLKALALAGALSVTGVVLTKCDREPENERYSLLDQELELRFWSVKAELIDSVQEYIDSVAPSSTLSALVLVNECSEANVGIIFALAQGQKESHFGTKGLGAKTNSVFNVGAYDGHNYDKIDNKFKYKHANKSIKPYLKLLNERYLVDKTEADLFNSFVDINKKRYASYKHYESDLKIIYDRICNTTKIKELEDEFLSLKSQREY